MLYVLELHILFSYSHTNPRLWKINCPYCHLQQHFVRNHLIYFIFDIYIRISVLIREDVYISDIRIRIYIYGSLCTGISIRIRLSLNFGIWDTLQCFQNNCYTVRYSHWLCILLRILNFLNSIYERNIHC